MSATKYVIAGFFLAAALIAMEQRGTGQGREGQRSGASGAVKSIGAGTITLTNGGGRGVDPTEKTYALAKQVEVAVGGTIGRAGGIYKEGKLADLSEGIVVHLSLSADEKTVHGITAEAPTVRGIVKAVDVKKSMLTISLGGGRGREPAEAEEKSYTMAVDAEVAVDDGRGRRFSIKEGKLEDLAQGAIVTLRLTLDRKEVQSVLAEGGIVSGTIKSLDAANKKVTLVVRPARGDDAAEERTLPVAADAVIIVDDGRGKLLSLKEAKLADVPNGASAMVKLSVDQAFAMLLRVEGAMVSGIFKSAEADKSTITIGIPKGRGEDPEEKTYTLAKGVRVTIDGAESKLADLKAVDNGPLIQLRLSLDQKTVQSVMAHLPRARE